MKTAWRMPLLAAVISASALAGARTHIPNDSLFCRDPFITADREAGLYYLIVSRSDGGSARLFAYRSKDLRFWDEVGYVFSMPGNYPGVNDWWAPDTYLFRGRYYCFVTVSNEARGILRGTTVLRSEGGVTGPYRTIVPDERLFVTPAGMQCLDGSLYIDEEGAPWLVFSVEWNGPNVKGKTGEVWCQRLGEGLDRGEGEPRRLFAADEAAWPVRGGGGSLVTDAPFVWKDKESGSLLMLWSSFAPEYSIGQAVSRSGSILGPWEHLEKPGFSRDGGHQMVFEDLEGNLKISFHSPNGRGSRLVIKDIRIKDGAFQPVE